MAWFKDKIDNQIKALIGDVVKAYIERSQVSFQLLSVKPQITGIEMAVLWAIGIAVMDDTYRKENEMPSELDRSLYEVTRDFFDSFCQSYVSNPCGSKITLTPESALIQESTAQTLKEMTPERRALTGRLTSALMANATELAAATIAMLSAGLNQDQKRAAAEHANFLLGGNKTLNAWQREKVNEWITNYSWS